jgi:hypothetical protein
MRCAQAGGPESADPPPAGVDALGGLPPPAVPWVEEPPVAAKLDRAPAAKLWRIELEAEAAARRTGSVAAEAAARPTPQGQPRRPISGGHGSPPGQAQRASAGHRRTRDGEARTNSRACAELGGARDQAGRDPRAEDPEAQHGERGQHDG